MLGTSGSVQSAASYSAWNYPFEDRACCRAINHQHRSKQRFEIVLRFVGVFWILRCLALTMFLRPMDLFINLQRV